MPRIHAAATEMYRRWRLNNYTIIDRKGVWNFVLQARPLCCCFSRVDVTYLKKYACLNSLLRWTIVPDVPAVRSARHPRCLALEEAFAHVC